MKQIIVPLVAGIAIGAAGVLIFTMPNRIGSNDAPVVRDLFAEQTLSATAAEAHRDQHYRELNSVEEIIALPTLFAKSEAMYALAGRSNAADIQRHIFDANRIADDDIREEALDILFYRLTEIDPRSALALARTPSFRADSSIERSIWKLWGLNDLNAALTAAKALPAASQKRFAAQGLFAAYGYMGTEATDRISESLQVDPDNNTRMLFVHQMADRSVNEAFAYILNMSEMQWQGEMLRRLAFYLAQKDPEMAASYAELIENSVQRRSYEQVIGGYVGLDDPKDVIDNFLANGGERRRDREVASAFRAMANRDLDAALAYIDQLESYNLKVTFGSEVAERYVAEDPAAAYAWAQKNDWGRYPGLQMSVLRHIAMNDAELAVALALEAPSAQHRTQMVEYVVDSVGHMSPESAATLVTQMKDGNIKTNAMRSLVMTWMQYDTDRAIDWVMDQEQDVAAELLNRGSYWVAYAGPETAARLLSRLPEGQARSMRGEIAQRMAAEQSPEQAMEFIRRYEAEPDYPQLQAGVIGGIGRNDPERAKLLADQLASGLPKDRALVQLAHYQAQYDPLRAMAWAAEISAPENRQTAISGVVAVWGESDPTAAIDWVKRQPDGDDRDHAVLRLVNQMQQPTDDQISLVRTMKNEELRSTAHLSQLMKIAHKDPDRARALMATVELSKEHAAQLEHFFDQGGGWTLYR